MVVKNRVAIVPLGNRNRPAYRLRGGKANYITIHETANLNFGANAAMHERFLHNGGGDASVSFHACVDDHEWVQLLPWNEVAWHAGDNLGDGNWDSIGIETCVNKDGDFTQTRRNLASLVAKLMFEFDIPIANVVQHNHWSGKDCPTKMRHNAYLWQETISWILTELSLLKNPVPVPAPPSPTPSGTIVNGFSVSGGFYDLWKNGGLVKYGLPLSAEYQEDVLIDNVVTKVTFQDFENVILEWRVGIDPRVGAGIRKYKYEKGVR
jgi:hypothetical protein